MICFRQTTRFAFAALLLIGVFACPVSLVAGKGNGHGGGGNGGGGEEPPPIAFSIDFLPVDHFPLGMNDLGDACGYGPGQVLEFVWLADGTLVYETEIIGEDELTPGKVFNLWHFEDINNFGQIAVTALNRDGSGERAVFRLTPGAGETPTIVDHIGDLSEGVMTPKTWAWAINDNGDIAGMALFPDPNANFGIGEAPYLYTDADGLMNLGNLSAGGSGTAYAVNELGEVAGASFDTSAWNWRAFRSSPDGTFANLGALSRQGEETRAFGINDAGEVVGFSMVKSGPTFVGHAFVYSDQTGMVDLGTSVPNEFTNAYDINNQGVIVGQSGGALNGDLGVAFLYIGGTMYRLSDLVVDLPADCELVAGIRDGAPQPANPIRINEFNEICATALFSDGTMAGCRLTPLP